MNCRPQTWFINTGYINIIIKQIYICDNSKLVIKMINIAWIYQKNQFIDYISCPICTQFLSCQ